MVIWEPPIDDYEFLLHEIFDVVPSLKKLGFDEVDREYLRMMMDGWSDYCKEVWLPINKLGDEVGLTYKKGKVSMPQEFKDAYKKGVDAGWFGTASSLVHGGMGAPDIFQTVIWAEFGTATNMAMSVLPALSVGVYGVLVEHGNKELIDYFAPKLSLGTWTGTMCLTEPHAGTDLGIITTKAIPQNEGHYILTGTKIFITYGEHDLAENIVHLVLAKTPNSPPGTQGISLFIVPKYLPEGYDCGDLSNVSNNLSENINGVSCSGVEEKMGLHASPTCVLNFDDSVGWLVGDLHTGMALMFEMMNRERLATGMMGLGIAEIAYQNSLLWSLNRRQGRSLNGARDYSEEADNILVHPDVRRMLLEAKVNNEGCRALSVWTGLLLDQMQSNDVEEKEMATALVSLFTPLVKAHFTELGCETVDTCMQVMGGAGYCSESGVEQFYRDVRISKIWEGTNGIQSLDLLGRKISKNMGKNMRYLLWPILEFIDENRDLEGMSEFTKPLYKGVRGLQQITLLLISKGISNPLFLAAGASDYTRYFGNIVLAYLWSKIAKVCLPLADKSPFHSAKLNSARIFFERIYPETFSLAVKIQAGHNNLMKYPKEMM